MTATVTSTAGQDLETTDAFVPETLTLHVALSPLDEQRAGLFEEIDAQLAILSGAAPPAAVRAPRPIRRAVSAAIPIPAKGIRRKRATPKWRIQRRFSNLQLAAVAGAIVITSAFGCFVGANLDAWLYGPLTGRAAVDAVVERIVSAESDGNATAKNKHSSATGPAQFIDETWLRLIRAYRPDLAKAHTRAQMLALRQDAKIARDMTRRFAERHAAKLARLGLPVTPATVYLAHFAGGAGAAALLTAPLDANAAQVMAHADSSGRTTREQIVKANPFLDKFSVADLRSWAEHKMQGPELHLSELVSASRKK